MLWNSYYDSIQIKEIVFIFSCDLFKAFDFLSHFINERKRQIRCIMSIFDVEMIILCFFVNQFLFYHGSWLFQTILQMDSESGQEESPRDLDENVVNIKDYSQHEPSEEEEDSPFDDLQNILGQDDNRQSRNELLLIEKIQKLQDKCNSLKEKNIGLGQTISDLQEDLRQYERILLEEPGSIELIETLQREVQSFKKELQNLRMKQKASNSEKDKEIELLRKQLDNLQQQKANIQDEKGQLIDTNQDLTKSNENLILQIEKLENQLAENRTELQSSRSYNINSRRDVGFESQIQAQLQILIEKLMSQLQLERNQKRRLNQQMKRIQKEILLLEKEISVKNNKIYQLQMSNLKQNRTKNVKSAITNNQPSKYAPIRARNETNNRVNRNTPMKNATLGQLIAQQDLSDRQRFIIAQKISDFYLKKINTREYISYQLDNLLVCNFNKSNPSLLSIRKNAASQFNVEANELKMLINLAEILDIILGEYLSEAKDGNSNDEYLYTLINQILTEKEVQVSDIYIIKQEIDEWLKARK